MPHEVRTLNVHQVLPYSIMLAIKENLHISFVNDGDQPSRSAHSRRGSNRLNQVTNVTSPPADTNDQQSPSQLTQPDHMNDHSNYSTDVEYCAYHTMVRPGPHDSSDEDSLSTFGQ
ncbi:hypothetical protein PIB30_029915 [Stylosanthes scabra]|uniref:Uncharacterized protein n=1 Tax=Stylosanthes scabra TaxID=79078 RepID=A0ABU6TB66_9FABA|nr:hypothetical protein [Stylosanthes scabra]